MPELRRGLSDVNLGLFYSEYVHFNLPVCQTAGVFILSHGLSVSQLAKCWINPSTLSFSTSRPTFLWSPVAGVIKAGGGLHNNIHREEKWLFLSCAKKDFVMK